MKILVVGSGGREHAMVWALARGPRRPTIYAAPGNAGIETLATCVPIKADDVAGLKTFAQSEKIDLTVVGPEAPLALGIVDEFRQSRLKIFGPTKGAARIEASKAFSKEVMASARILTEEPFLEVFLWRMFKRLSSKAAGEGKTGGVASWLR